jgi:four helix bundle protein
MTRFRFAHHRLDAYRVAVEMADRVDGLVARFPRGHARLADQLRRSAEAVVALTAEGANRYSAGQKRQRFTEARGECGEVAAHIERACRRRLVRQAEALAVLTLADRVCAMLSGLIRRCS